MKVTDGSNAHIFDKSKSVRSTCIIVCKNEINARVCPAAKEINMTENDTLSQNEREELENLRREKKLREKTGLTLKVSEKGGVSLYGLGRFPVTLYKEQWLKVLDFCSDIAQFIKDHDSELKSKNRTSE